MLVYQRVYENIWKQTWIQPRTPKVLLKNKIQRWGNPSWYTINMVEIWPIHSLVRKSVCLQDLQLNSVVLVILFPKKNQNVFLDATEIP